MASSSTKHDVERLVGHCVTHLQDHASHYLSLIQSKRVEGVLWAVFRVGERLLPQGAQQGVELHKASFLALSSMVSSKADVLLRMQRDCDQERQFVCWFTLDDAKGSAVASKVLTIDAGAPVAESRHDDDDVVGQDAPTQHAHGSSVLSHFRNRHERQPGQRSTSRDHNDHHHSAASLVSAVYATPSVAPTTQPLRGTRQEEHTEPGRPRSPRTVRDLLAAVAKTSAPPSKPAEPIRPTTEVSNSGAAEANVTMLMRMVMQVADSVASMGAAMDQLSLRCTSIESEMKQVKDRVHLIEVPMFGDDYDFNASSSPSTSRMGHAGVDGQGQKPHVAWQSNDATMNGSHNNSKQKRALLSASEMLIQLTELSLRVGETENRVRVLESSKEAAELQRKILHEQVDALKIRMSDFVKSSQRLQESNSMLGNRDQQSSRHYNPPTASEAPSLSNEYPWRQHQQDGAEHQRQSGDANRQWSTSATATSSSIAAATRMMDSPFRGYTPPLSSHPTSHNARRLSVDDSPPRGHQPTPASFLTNPQMVATRSEKEYHYETSSLHVSSQVDKTHHEQQQHQQRTMGQPQGALTDMIRSLETKLGGIRSAR